MAKKTSNKLRTGDGYMATPRPMKPSKPEFGVTERELPEIKDWQVGKKYQITIEAEMVSMSKDSDYDAPLGNDGERSKVTRARFKILKAEECTEGDE